MKAPRQRLSLALPSIALFLGLGLAAMGQSCGNFCFLKVCNGGECTCPLSGCGDGAQFDTRSNKCRCATGFFTVAGQCLDQVHATAYCGKGFSFKHGGCVKVTCRHGEALDVSTGRCIPKAELAAQAGVEVKKGEKVGCPAGSTLIADNGRTACVPLSQTCAKDETWDGEGCAKNTACPAGSAFNADTKSCVPYANSSNNELSVDVATWATSTYGPDGGMGTASFCSTFSTKPWSFGISAGATAIVRVTVSLSFPDQIVNKGQVQTQAQFDTSGAVVPAAGVAAVQGGAESSFFALTTGGGKASAPMVTSVVKCAVTNGAKPQAVPESGGG